VWLSEQLRASLRANLERAGLGREEISILRFSQTLGLMWPVVANAAIAECERIGARLLVVDTLGQFTGIQGERENAAGDALAAMVPLQLAAERGIGILLNRHERKIGGDVGDSGRGSSAYAGAVDTVVAIRRPPGKTRPTLRLLRAISRFDDVPDELMVELTPTGYVPLGSATNVAAVEAEEAILAALPASKAEAITLDEVLRRTAAKRVTAQRAIEHLLKAGGIARKGMGRKHDPFRYHRPEIRSAQRAPRMGRKKQSASKRTSQVKRPASKNHRR
jgi:hypothetical protein